MDFAAIFSGLALSCGTVFNGIVGNFTQFFSWEMLSSTLADPANWGIIASLVILEGLLSADNAIVLAVMVKHLAVNEQKKALLYGIFGAWGFRLVAILLGTYLIKIWWIKLVGAAYLLKMAIEYFAGKSDGDDEPEDKPYGFWRTVLAVELMDIAFSMDSILASFGVSNKTWVLYIGGVLGILMMRGVAQIFLVLLEKYPRLETTAYALIMAIGLRMLGATFGYEIPDMYFFLAFPVIFILTLSVPFKKTQTAVVSK